MTRKMTNDEKMARVLGFDERVSPNEIFLDKDTADLLDLYVAVVEATGDADLSLDLEINPGYGAAKIDANPFYQNEFVAAMDRAQSNPPRNIVKDAFTDYLERGVNILSQEQLEVLASRGERGQTLAQILRGEYEASNIDIPDDGHTDVYDTHERATMNDVFAIPTELKPMTYWEQEFLAGIFYAENPQQRSDAIRVYQGFREHDPMLVNIVLSEGTFTQVQREALQNAPFEYVDNILGAMGFSGETHTEWRIQTHLRKEIPVANSDGSYAGREVDAKFDGATYRVGEGPRDGNHFEQNIMRMLKD